MKKMKFSGVFGGLIIFIACASNQPRTDGQPRITQSFCMAVGAGANMDEAYADLVNFRKEANKEGVIDKASGTCVTPPLPKGKKAPYVKCSFQIPCESK